MGEEYWWFYDVIAVAVIAVCVFIAAKKGLFKSGLSLTGYIVAIGLALSISSAAANSIYKNSVKVNNVKNLKKSVYSGKFLEKTSDYIESLGYPNVKVSENKLLAIYTSDPRKKTFDEQIYDYINNQNANIVDPENIFYEKLHEGYAQIISGIISDKLSEYSAEYAAEAIREKPYTTDELIPLMIDNQEIERDTSKEAAEYICDHYTEKPYKTQVRLAAFVIILVVLIALTVFILTAVKSDDFNDLPVASNLLGGVIGAIKGVIILLGIAAMIRLYVVLGSNKMLFFNNKAIDNSHIFRYIYSFITDNF
ncbi:MAG: hypothetical protein GXY08_01970 [Ruminococcus sp.]|nr:hypothetical protein [Ruminococcus sp.]